jgi:hypothetical protein
MTGVLIFFALVIGGVVYVVVQQGRVDRQERVAKLSAGAAEYGWQYTEKDMSLVDRFAGEPFGKGYSRSTADVLRGTRRGREFVAFSYSYTEGSRDNGSTTYVHTVAVLSLPCVTPMLQIGREGRVAKLLDFVGRRDLQLESAEFNDAFRVDTDDEKFAYTVLHPRLMRWLLDSPRADYTPFRFERGALLAWQKDTIEVPKAQWMVDYLSDVADQVPSFVWKS